MGDPTNRRTLLKTAVGVTGLIGSAGSASANSEANSPLQAQLNMIRGLTNRYRGTKGIKKAYADGFVPSGFGPPGNWGLIRTPVGGSVDLRDPDGLMYVERDGRLQLGAVRYVLTGTDVDRPDLFNDGRADLVLSEEEGWSRNEGTAYAVFSDQDDHPDEDITDLPPSDVFNRENWRWVRDQPGTTVDVDFDGSEERVDYVFEKPPATVLHAWVHVDNPCGLFNLWYDRCSSQ